MKIKKILLLILFTFFLVFISNTSFASNEGISTLSVVDEYEKNDDGSYTYNYTYHGTSQVYTGSVTIPAEFYDDTQYPNWILGICDDGKPIIFYTASSSLSKFLLVPRSSSSTINLTSCSLFCYATDRSYAYDSTNSILKHITYSDGVWSSASNTASVLKFLPSGFLYSHNADVYYTDVYVYTGSSISTKTPFNQVVNGNLNEYYIQSACFYGTTPYLVELSDTKYKVALGTCYDGYTYTAESDSFVNVTDTLINNLYINIVDNDGEDFLYSYTYGPLESYINLDENYGMVLEIPLDDFTFLGQSFEFISGHTYTFSFQVDCTNTVSKGNFTYDYYDTCNFSNDLTYGSGSSVGGDTDDTENTINNQIANSIDAQTNAINEQTNIMQEQHETSKGIWVTLTEVLSYINPFSENFFVYKLIDLLVEALKSLFIPADGFFDTFFTDLKNWFEEKLGFLFYPFELIINILNRIVNIDFSEPIFEIPDIPEPFTGAKLISAATYNLNSILENSVFKTIHDIYLIVVDAIIIFALVNLFKEKFNSLLR